MSRHGDEHLYPGLDPPLGAISVQETSQTRTRLRQLPALGVSMLTLSHALLARQLAGHEAERFAGVAITASLSGAVYIEAGLSTSMSAALVSSARSPMRSSPATTSS